MMGPDYQRPPIESPANFRDQTPTQDTQSIADLPRWNLFQDPVLVRLVGEAVQNNRDLRGAVARWRRPAPWLGSRRRRSIPALTANAGASYGRGQRSSSPPTTPPPVRCSRSDAQMSCGRIEHSGGGSPPGHGEAAVAEYLASEQGRRAATVSLVAEVATAYVELRQLDAQLAISRRTVKNYQRTLQLCEDQPPRRRGNRLPVTTGRAQVNEAEATAQDAERLIVRTGEPHLLLLGRPPDPVGRGPETCSAPAPAPSLPGSLDVARAPA